MSAQLVRSEILRFLRSSGAEVLCIHGAWGAGKTYAWREFLKQAATSGGVALDRYSYVSLFGLNSLNDLKYAIFESTVSVASSITGPSFRTLQDYLKSLEWVGRKSAGLLQYIPKGLTTYGDTARDLLSTSYFLAVRNQIICLDDLERKGAGFSLTDALGLVSQLKEERHCKVVLLLNSNALEGDDSKAFTTYLEKVVDRSLEFAPTSHESAEIALPDGDDISKQLVAHVVTLGISNIRVIKRIEFMARELREKLAAYHPEVSRRVCQSMVLLAWAYYQPATAPSLEFLTTKKAQSSYDVTGRSEASPEETSWNKLLDEYGYTWTDEFDLAILAGIKSGYFDAAVIDRLAQPMHEEIVAGHNVDAFREAWTRFNASFADNEDEVVRAIGAALRDRVKYVPLTGLNSVVELLRYLGRPHEATEAIKFYIESRDEDERFWDIDDHPFLSDISDPELREAINTKKATYQKEMPETGGLLRQLTEGDGLNSPTLAPLSKAPVDEFVRVFGTTEGQDLRHMVEACLRYRRIGGATHEMQQIAERATLALTALGRASRLNAFRVLKLYGIKVEDEKQTGDAEAVDAVDCEPPYGQAERCTGLQA